MIITKHIASLEEEAPGGRSPRPTAGEQISRPGASRRDRLAARPSDLELRRAINRLAPLERRIIRGLYGLDRPRETPLELEAQLGLSGSYLAAVHGQALVHLRNRLGVSA